MLRRYLLYLVRWQLSTPILAVCCAYFAHFGNVIATIIANFIGGLLFFWVDRFIFSRRLDGPIWAVEESVTCAGCGQVTRGYRLVATRNYDRRQDETPQFRCEPCSARKVHALRADGVVFE